MRRFIQYYKMSTGYIAGTIPPQFGEPFPIEACGSDSVDFHVDGRLSIESVKNRARQHAKKRGFVGFSILSGESLRVAKTIHDFEQVS